MNGTPYNQYNGNPSGYANGYTPTQFQSAANEGFWGTLLDQGWMPSELFCRLADSIFFHLDANAQASYPNSGFIEPDKNMWWSTYVQMIPQDKAVNDYVVKHAMSSLYDACSVPYQVVTLRDSSTLPILDRAAFLHSLVSSAKTDPVKFLQKLNKSLASFNLVDPATSQPFPGPIPATAMPMACDWAAQSAFKTWQMSVATQYRMHAYQKHQTDMARKRMFKGAVHMLTGGLGGGSTGGGSGFGGLGGNSTPFGF